MNFSRWKKYDWRDWPYHLKLYSREVPKASSIYVVALLILVGLVVFSVQRRRSSILKTIRVPPTLLAELDANPVTSTYQTISRQESFSRKTETAEVLTQEATTKLKNVHNEHHDSTLGPSVNSSEGPCCGDSGRLFEGEAQDVEAELNEVNKPSTQALRDTYTHQKTASINLTDQLTTQGTVCEDINDSAAPTVHLEVNATINDDCKPLSDIIADFVTGECSGVIEVHFSPVNLNQAAEQCNDNNSLGVKDQVKRASVHIKRSNNNLKLVSNSAPEIGQADMSDAVISVRLNSPAGLRSTRNIAAFECDWIAEKENELFKFAQEIDCPTSKIQDMTLLYHRKELKYGRIDDDFDDVEYSLSAINENHQHENILFENHCVEANVSITQTITSTEKHCHKESKCEEDNCQNNDLIVGRFQVTRKFENHVTAVDDDKNIKMRLCVPIVEQNTQSGNQERKCSATDIPTNLKPARIGDASTSIVRCLPPDLRNNVISNLMSNKNVNNTSSNKPIIVFDKDEVEAEISVTKCDDERLIIRLTPPQTNNSSIIKTNEEVLVYDGKKLKHVRVDDDSDDLIHLLPKRNKGQDYVNDNKKDKSMALDITSINQQKSSHSKVFNRNIVAANTSTIQSVPSSVKHYYKENIDEKENLENIDLTTGVSRFVKGFKNNVTDLGGDADTSIIQCMPSVEQDCLLSQNCISTDISPDSKYNRDCDYDFAVARCLPLDLRGDVILSLMESKSGNVTSSNSSSTVALDKDNIGADTSTTQYNNHNIVPNRNIEKNQFLHETHESGSKDEPIISVEEDNAQRNHASSQTLTTKVLNVDNSKHITASSSSKRTSPRPSIHNNEAGQSLERIGSFASSREHGLTCPSAYAAPASLPANLRSQIDALPFMGSRHCEWETALTRAERGEAHKRGAWWWFRLLHTRLRLGIRIANVAGVSPEGDAILAELVVTADLHGCRDPVVSLCVRLAAEAARVVCAKESGATASRTPILLHKLVNLSRLAARWGREVHSTRLSLALAVEEYGTISFNVPNVPLRCIWEVRMHVELDRSEEPAKAPWPRATRVSARLASPGKAAVLSAGDLQGVLRGVPHNWGHVPTTIWRVFHYLKNKTCYDASVDA